MMKRTLPILAVVAACYSGPKGAETARDLEHERSLEARWELEHGKTLEAMAQLERQLEELNQKLDGLIARGAPGARPPRPQPDRARTYAVPIAGNPFDGRADAKVTLVKAYDYACGYCERVRGTMDELKKKYGKDLRIVYKQLVIHPRNAKVGALAFCAAARQGKHREMDALIWDKGFNARQLDLTEIPLDPVDEQHPAQAPVNPATVKCWDHPDGCRHVDGYAAELRLDLRKFKADLKGACQQLVVNDGRELAQLGAAATPTFFINGRYLAGAQPLEVFSALIDEELAKASERIAAGTPAASYYQRWVLDVGLRSLEP